MTPAKERSYVDLEITVKRPNCRGAVPAVDRFHYCLAAPRFWRFSYLFFPAFLETCWHNLFRHYDFPAFCRPRSVYFVCLHSIL